MSGESLDRLKALTEAVRLRKPVPDAVREWFLQGTSDYPRNKQRLDACLGLTGRGKSLPWVIEAHREADRQLLRAVRLIQQRHNVSGYGVWKLLAAELARFTSRVWPRVRGRGASSQRLDELDEHFYRALTELGDNGKLPESASGLARRLRGKVSDAK